MIKTFFIISHFFIFHSIIFITEQSFAAEGFSASFFAEIYNETMNIQHEGRNAITMTQSLQGLRMSIPNISTIDVYLKERYGSDANRDYWNNRGELMLGIRARFLKKVYLGLYYEYINGKYFGVENSENPNPYGSNYEDMRYGLIFWYGSDFEFNNHWTKTFPFSYWDEVYSDATYYKRDSKNFIFYLNGKAGARLLRIYKFVLDYYFVNYLMYDKNGDFWNNKFEFGIGFRIKPWTDIDISVFVESLKGSYLERDGRYPNPYNPGYSDVRIGLLFWHGW